MEIEQVITTLEQMSTAAAEHMEREALLTAVRTLRNGSRAAPRAAGTRWSDDEDAQLCREFDEGMNVAEIATQHGRTRTAISLRLVKLGRLDEESVRMRERRKSLPS